VTGAGYSITQPQAGKTDAVDEKCVSTLHSIPGEDGRFAVVEAAFRPANRV